MVTEPQLDWLTQAAKAGVCPLCLAVTRHESDALAKLCDDLHAGGDEADAFAAARGLCTRHTVALERAVEDGAVDPQQVFAGYLAMLDRLLTDLSDLEHDEWLFVDECPLCAASRRAVVLCAHRLLFELERDPDALTQALTHAGGLCVPHFTTCWEISPEGADRGRLRDIERDATTRLVQRLRDLQLDGNRATHGDPRTLMREARSFTCGYHWELTHVID